MATFEYSEHYSETNLVTGIKREFRRSWKVTGEREEVLPIMDHAFKLMPVYNYPLLKNDEMSALFEKIYAKRLSE